MTYTETQLEAIKLFWKKDLSFWCLLKMKRYPSITTLWTYCSENEEYKDSYYTIRHGESWERDECLLIYCIDEYEILWHIPHLEDLFRVAEEKWKVVEVRNVCYSRIELFTKDNPFPLCVPYNPTLPLLLQPEDTLTQLCNLFK